MNIIIKVYLLLHRNALPRLYFYAFSYTLLGLAKHFGFVASSVPYFVAPRAFLNGSTHLAGRKQSIFKSTSGWRFARGIPPDITVSSHRPRSGSVKFKIPEDRFTRLLKSLHIPGMEKDIGQVLHLAGFLLTFVEKGPQLHVTPAF